MPTTVRPDADAAQRLLMTSVQTSLPGFIFGRAEQTTHAILVLFERRPTAGLPAALAQTGMLWVQDGIPWRA